MDIITSVISLIKDGIYEEENSTEILQTDLRPVENLLVDITTLFQEQRKEAQEALKIWMQLLHNSFMEARSLRRRSEPEQRQRCFDCFIMCNPGRLSEEIKDWKVLFYSLFQGLQTDLSIFVSAHQIVHRDPIPALSAEGSEQSLSRDEAWALFQKIALMDDPVIPMDIELCARNIVDCCKGSALAITAVAAAMIGKTSLVDWETSLWSMKNADPSFANTSHSARIDPELYQLLRWSYDALPSSNIQNCFLYCAMYPEDECIRVEDLVQKWIAEGFVRSKQETHLMDMAIGRIYVNILVDRCLFQNVSNEEIHNGWGSSDDQCIRVHSVIREMAIYIGEVEQNCLFKAGQGMQNFPTIHYNKDCKRILLSNNAIENLPTKLPCPKLVSLILSSNSISVIPSGFLAGLTSLKVLDLSYNNITSIPLAVGQLKQLEFLRLEYAEMEDLPEEICHLPSLQFLYLRQCNRLQSLPSQIGKLRNLKYLNLFYCENLRAIPHEISQLTSLNTLDMECVDFSLEAESETSICRLKGLINLKMLRIYVKVDVREGKTSPGIEGGIMGSWLEMRHLYLCFVTDSNDDYVMADLPHDMQNMRMLQSFIMGGYNGLSLPEYTCKFQHLQYLELNHCRHLQELSPLERLPNLKYLKLYHWPNSKELGILNRGKASVFLMLEELVLSDFPRLHSLAGPSNNGAWNERTLPRLRTLKIWECPCLKILPVGMHKLLNLNTLLADSDWWQQIIWKDDLMKIQLTNLFKKWQYVS